MSCFQVFCATSVGHLCLRHLPWGSPSHSVLLPLTDCGGSTLLNRPFILSILHWINFTLAHPGIPAASPLPSPNPDSSCFLEIMSIICLDLASKRFNIYQHIKEKYFLSIIIYCSHPTPRGARRYFAIATCGILPACWFCSWKRAQRRIVKMLMGWLCNWHCLWAAGVQFRPWQDPQRTPEESIWITPARLLVLDGRSRLEEGEFSSQSLHLEIELEHDRPRQSSTLCMKIYGYEFLYNGLPLTRGYN